MAFLFPSSVSTSSFRVPAGPSINFQCGRKTSVNFYQLSVHLRDLPPTFCMAERLSINFLCIRGTFHQLFVHPRYLPLTSVNFCVAVGPSKKFHTAAGPSGNFIQLSVWSQDLPSTFRTIMGPSVSFPYVRGTFCQLSICPRDIPSSFVNFSCIRVIILLYSLHLRSLPSTSDNFRSIHGTCHQLFVHRFELP